MTKPHPDHSSPEWLFRELHQAHRAAVDSVFARLGVRELGQPHLLFVLERENAAGVTPTQKELADRLKLSPATVAKSIKSLERLGCLHKLTDDSDMRKNRIQLTDTGREISEKCRQAFRNVDRAMYSGFSDEETELISQLYIRMAKNLRDLAAENSHAPEGEDKG